jgi:hypothetical protein
MTVKEASVKCSLLCDDNHGDVLEKAKLEKVEKLVRTRVLEGFKGDE